MLVKFGSLSKLIIRVITLCAILVSLLVSPSILAARRSAAKASVLYVEQFSGDYGKALPFKKIGPLTNSAATSDDPNCGTGSCCPSMRTDICPSSGAYHCNS